MQEIRYAMVDGEKVPVLISDENEALQAAKAARRAIVGLWREDGKENEWCADTLITDVEDADEEFLERIARRHLGLPWTICETERLILREIAERDYEEIVKNHVDDGLDTAEAANILEKLTTVDNVDAIVSGSYSGPTKVAAPICQDAGIVMVSAYAVHPDVVNAGDYIFSQSFPGAVQATAAAQFAVGELKANRIAIVAVDLDFGKEQAAYFKAQAAKLGAEIVSEDYIAISDNDMTSVITKIKDEKVDLIYMPNYYAHASEVCRQVALQGLDVKILGCEGADSWQLLETAGEYAKGLYITTNMNRDDANEGTQAYIKNYQAEYKMEPDMVGASVYDAFQVLFAAFENVGTDPAAMRDYIAGLKDFDTVTGTLMYYTSAGSAVKPVQIQQVGDDILFHSYGIIDDINIIDGDKVEKVTY